MVYTIQEIPRRFLQSGLVLNNVYKFHFRLIQIRFKILIELRFYMEKKKIPIFTIYIKYGGME